MRDELSSDLAELRPRRALVHLVDVATRLDRLREKRAPAVIFDDELQRLSELVGWLERVEARGPSSLRFFELERTAQVTCGGWTLRYARFDEDVGDEVAELDLATPTAAFLASTDNVGLLEQQLELMHAVRRATGVPPASPGSESDAPSARGEGYVSLLAELRRTRSWWYGLQFLPLLLGRLAALLGEPPEAEQPGALVVLDDASGGGRWTIGIGEGDTALVQSSLAVAAVDVRVVEARAVAVGSLLDALWAGPQIADVAMAGSSFNHEPYVAGVRRGRLFCDVGEAVLDRVAPWFGVPR